MRFVSFLLVASLVLKTNAEPYQDLCDKIQQIAMQAVMLHRDEELQARDDLIMQGISSFEQARTLKPDDTQVLYEPVSILHMNFVISLMSGLLHGRHTLHGAILSSRD